MPVLKTQLAWGQRKSSSSYQETLQPNSDLLGPSFTGSLWAEEWKAAVDTRCFPVLWAARDCMMKELAFSPWLNSSLPAELWGWVAVTAERTESYCSRTTWATIGTERSVSQLTWGESAEARRWRRETGRKERQCKQSVKVRGHNLNEGHLAQCILCLAKMSPGAPLRRLRTDCRY